MKESQTQDLASLMRRLGLARADVIELALALGADPLERLANLSPDPHAPEATAVLRTGAPELEDLGRIARGAQGEVRRVRDRRLRREVAMKLLLPEYSTLEEARQRFVQEAQITAQLQHPGIVPVHQFTVAADGREGFVMAEIRGTTFAEAIREVHDASTGDEWVPSRTGRTFRGLLSAFQAACNAVGYAHARGVFHRDLKPENVMLGEHGEVLVVDWGLAVVDRGAASIGNLVRTDRSELPPTRAVRASIEGTPSYMAPEQARGDLAAIDHRTDVYALGAVLYHILSGRPPFRAPTVEQTLLLVRTQDPPPPGRLASATWETLTMGFDDVGARPVEEQVKGPPLPAELVEACMRALSRDPSARHRDASELGADVQAWLDGSRRAQQAEDVVAIADAIVPEMASIRARADGLREAAARQLAAVPEWAPASQKHGAWLLREEAENLDLRAGLLAQKRIQLLHGALSHYEGVASAHLALAEDYRRLHEAAERRRARDEEARLEALVRTHAAAVSPTHERRLALDDYLGGHGALRMATDTPATSVLYRYRSRFGRSVPEVVGEYALPLDLSLPRGSYLLEVSAPGRHTTSYPFELRRGGRWEGRAGGDGLLRLPAADAILPNERYVPAGWAELGGDPDASHSWSARRMWVDTFCVARDAVTMAEYAAFVADLHATDPKLAWSRVPATAQGKVLWIAGPDGVPSPPEIDQDGDRWHPSWPVFCVRYEDAVAYTEWLARRVPGARLLTEAEWEKAARGVDARIFPWGDQFDPAFCKMAKSRPPAEKGPEPVGAFPIDVSVYGVRDLSGSMATWCEGHFEGSSVLRPIRGGAWSFFAPNVRPARRVGVHGATRSYAYGIRWGRSLQ